MPSGFFLDKALFILQTVVVMSPFSALLVGLTTGGLTCMAVQGGLLLGLLAQRTDESSDLPGWRRFVFPVSAFLIAKTIAYTIIGFLLGLVGASVVLSPTAKLWMQTLAAGFMILTGIRLLWPQILPWLTFTPPARVRRFVRRNAKSQTLFAPAILGALTVLIPCGTTQSMEVNAIATGSAWQGAVLMAAFTIGTAPLFFLIGLAAKSTATVQRRLTTIAAGVVICLGIYSFNGVLVATGSNFSFQHQVAAARYLLSREADESSSTVPILAEQTIQVNSIGYEPNFLRVPTNKPVTLTLVTNGNSGCTSVFRLPKFNIERTLPATGTTTVTTTFDTAGQYTFSCGMGMFTGTIEAVAS